MTTTRVLILLVVLVAILFVISLAVGSRNGGKIADPEAGWLQKLTPSQKFNLGDVVPTNGWQNGRWIIPRRVLQAALEIKASPTGQTIRRAELSLQGDGPFSVQFVPRPDPNDPNKFADPDATVLKLKSLKSGKKPVALTILKHGGTLVVSRTSASVPATFTLE